MSTLQTFFNNLPTHVQNTFLEYKKPLSENRFYINKEYILLNNTTRKIKFNNNRWEYRPYLFCLDIYSESEQYLYPIILTINNINSIHSFIPDSFKNQLIYAPNISLIKKILTF